MTYVQSIVPVGKQVNYNAAKIQVNQPKTIIPEGFNNNNINDGIYTGVDIQVNEPTVDFRRDKTYEYPVYSDVVTYDMIEQKPINSTASVPAQDGELSENKSNTSFNGLKNTNSEVIEEENSEDENNKVAFKGENEEVVTEEITEDENNKVAFKGENEEVVIEESTEDENNKVAFKGENEEVVAEESTEDESNKVAFKGENEEVVAEESTEDENNKVAFKGDKKKIEIVPGQDMLPEVNISDVVSRLSSNDYDIQAAQMVEIVNVMLNSSEKLNQYVVKDVFVNLIKIAEKNTDNLEKPTKEQEQLRTKIMLNVAALETAKKDGNTDDVELPYTLSDAEIEKAVSLSDYEMAERNKEYALDTIAILSKEYANEIETKTGNIVGITDLPGVSSIVNALKNEKSPSVKIAAINSLLYLSRPEYNNEIAALLKIVGNDRNPFVSQNAIVALESLAYKN